jgi:hypothetical protein
MKKMIPFILLLVFVSCGKKSWNKEYVSEDCMKEMKKNEQAAGMFTDATMKDICDCSAEKTVAKYKSEAEAQKDQSGLMEIGADCAREALGK